MEDIYSTISIITSNVNGLKNTISKERESQWTKQDPTISCLQATNFKYKNLYMLKVKDGKLYHANTNQKKAEVTILTSDKADFVGQLGIKRVII